MGKQMDVHRGESVFDGVLQKLNQTTSGFWGCCSCKSELPKHPKEHFDPESGNQKVSIRSPSNTKELQSVAHGPSVACVDIGHSKQTQMTAGIKP